ncbi:AraC family ligand binding domain-containing protein [Cohnella sp.]|uniref:cupin domain-containing protein n=1 Tax=Cohnella sp. TaxID=1883426 RepID=UPI003569C9C7
MSPFIELSYVSEGKGYHYIEGNTIPVDKGDLFFLPVGVSHVFRPTSTAPDQRRLIVYNCIFTELFSIRLLHSFLEDERLRQLLKSAYPEQSWLHLHDRYGFFQHSFNIMYEEFCQRRSNYVTMVQSEVMRLLIHITRELDERVNELSRPRRKRDTDSGMDAITEQLRRQPSESLGVREYAAKSGISERH